MFADILFNLPFDRKFTYSVPHSFSFIKKGDRVKVPFGSRNMTGIVLNVKENPDGIDDISKIKEILELYSPYFRMTEIQFELARRIWLYYLSGYGQAVHTVAGAYKDVRIKKQIFEINPENKILLNVNQNNAINQFMNTDKKTSLLYGVTGSGKTEVYFTIIEQFMQKNKQALYLLPEIALTPQIVKRFTDRFGEKVAVFNSKLSNGERNYALKSFRQGEIDLLIGTRSAVFLPAKHLGVIILDEEHESTFKQQDNPCYDTRTVAQWRGELENVKVIFGSATPSLESFKLSVSGDYEKIMLDKRGDGRKMPDVFLVDMAIEKKVSRNISRKMHEEIINTLQKKEQVLLFHNRRGFSSFQICKSCGEVIKCKNCDITLNYHKKINKLICHYCDFWKTPPKKCEKCNSEDFEFMGSGTEKIEEEIQDLFPKARIIRVDRDTSSSKNFYSDFYKKMINREFDIIIGTQMIGKGFDFPYVTLVGVLWADFILDFPDFRSAERTAQLLSQVAGRSGRARDGKVFIQTYAKDHYAILCAKDHNYPRFFGEEIERRKILKYPPFISFVRVVLTYKDKVFLENSIADITSMLKLEIGQEYFLGPAKAAVFFIKGMFRYNILFKINNNRKQVYEVIKKIKSKNPKIRFKIDVDPIDMM
ncbi:MAG: primosomal protein N' [Candidatus Muirbacterium halophilum]|nr:primosomal protein N' [Candidatus Muirbacterium halophilum]